MRAGARGEQAPVGRAVEGAVGALASFMLVTRGRIRQIEAKTLATLKSQGDWQQLQDCLD
jgi:DNA-directed RNA polymerase sigma subunit (sigma70/sigma32)